MDRIDDTEIMKRLKAGDGDVLAIVLSKILPEIWPLLIRKFRESLTHEDIEDIAASSLAKLWKYRDKFDSTKGDFNGWFYVILRNTALDFLRRRRPKQEETLRIVPMTEASNSLNEQEKLSALEKAILVLSPREQQVLLPLFNRSGVSVGQLGEELSLSSGAVRQLRFRALRKLESALRSVGFAVKRS